MPPPAGIVGVGRYPVHGTMHAKAARGSGCTRSRSASKIVIASHAGGVTWQSQNRTSRHSAECLTPTNQIATVPRHVAQHLAMT